MVPRKLTVSTLLLMQSLLIVFLQLPGCRQDIEPLLNDPDFEKMGPVPGVPEGWTLSVKSGEYRCAGTGKAQVGKTALAIGGAGGASELRSNAFTLHAGQALDCQLWLSGDLKQQASAMVGVACEDDGPEDGFCPMASVNTRANEWTNVRFIYAPAYYDPVLTSALVVKLNGEGLLRLDGVVANLIRVAPQHFLPDGDFEFPRTDDTFLKWTLNADTEERTALCHRETPFQGKSCLRVSGKGGWCVCTSDIRFPASSARIYLQAMVRAHEGKANLKMEYSSDEKYLGGSYSSDVVSKDWQLVVMEMDPELASQADYVGVSLAVSTSTGSYSADFDKIRIIVCYPP